MLKLDNMSLMFQLLAGLVLWLPTVSAGDTLTIAYAEAAPFILKKDGQIHGPSIWVWEQVGQQMNQPYILKEMAFPIILQGHC